MKIKLLLTFIGITFLAASCKKNSNEDAIVNQSINTMVVPASFKWQTARDVKFNIGIHDTRFQNALHVVELFIGDPASGGTSIAKGAGSIINSFNFKVEIPATVNEVYLIKTAPDGTKLTQKVLLTSTDISLSIGSESITQVVSNVSTTKSFTITGLKSNVVTETSPDCNFGCDTEITSSPQGPINLNGKTFCITGNNVTVNVNNEKSGTLRICGKNVIVNNLSLADNLTVIVANTGSVTFNNLNWDGAGTFKNFGIANVGNVKINGNFYNAGLLNCTDFLVSSGTASNISTITTTGNTIINGTFENTGTLSTKGLALGSSTAYLTNSGTITVENNFDAQGTILNSGNLTIKGIFNSNNNPNFTNSGNLNLSQNISIGGTFTNSGVLTTTNGEINLNGNPSLINSGTFNATNSKMNTSGTINNSGSMTLKYLTVNSGTFTNNCKLLVLTDFDNNGIIKNYSYIQVDNNTNLKGTLNFYNSAMFQTKYLIAADGNIIGEGNTSLFKVVTSSTDNVNANGTKKFQGTLQYCDPSRTLSATQFTGGAIQACDVYIAKSNCNTVGNGTAPGPVKKDTDGDGILDEEDAYPNDATRAFNNYSVNYTAGGSTVAFEDSWPLKGDYDLNDVVISYKYLVITNALNKVVHIKADYTLLATGGEFKNGAGIQFNLPSSSATGFTSTNGSTLESGQDSVVVILFTNSRNEQPTWNTISGQSPSAAKAYSISFNVSNGPSLSTFGIGTYNPFIWNNTTGYGRGYETHLFGKNPTKLANTSLFGTGDDASSAGKYYSTKANLPWAITVPTSPFKYPVERISITETYLRFSNWATSGGSSSIDWYSNTTEGYRNTTKIYTGN